MAKRIPSPTKSKKQNTAELATKDSELPTEVRIILNEVGTTGLKEQSGFVAEAYNSALHYPGVYAAYNRIRRSMPEMVMVRQAFTAWSRKVSPIVDLPDEPTDDDKRYQEFIEQDFENMEGGFTSFIDTAVNHVPFLGWSWWEAIPGIRDEKWVPPPFVGSDGQFSRDEWRSEYSDGLIGIRRLGWRDHNTFDGWVFNGQKRMIAMQQRDHPNPPVILPKEKSLHISYGDPNNPEGLPGLEPVWRIERLKFNFEQILGIGAEHSAGFFMAKKTERGSLTDSDKALVKAAARALLTAQEGNYGLLPFGVDGQLIDSTFSAAYPILNVVKYYSITALSLFMTQFIALNTLTETGAQASQVDSTNIAVFSYNGMLDGLAAQYDQQIGKRLFLWNRDAFPNITKRPTIRFSHVENNIDLGALGSFLSQIKDFVPLGEDDLKEFRKRSGWMPETLVDPEDSINMKPKPTPAPLNPDQNQNALDDNSGDNAPMPDDATVQSAQSTKQTINQALRFYSRQRRSK